MYSEPCPVKMTTTRGGLEGRRARAVGPRTEANSLAASSSADVPTTTRRKLCERGLWARVWTAARQRAQQPASASGVAACSLPGSSCAAGLAAAPPVSR